MNSSAVWKRLKSPISATSASAVSVSTPRRQRSRPGFFCGYVQPRATSWRCHASNVSGFTGKLVHAGRG